MKTEIIANGMEFVNDEEVIGKWEHFSRIKSMDEFNPKLKTPITDKEFKEIYFLENGQKYWIFEGWTKGFLLIHYGGDEPILSYKYSIRKEANDVFLFIEIVGHEPYTFVLKKVSNKHFKINEIGQRDNIDLTFVQDEKVLGNWQSVGFVDNIDDFIPNNACDDLWLKQIAFKDNGSVARVYSDELWEDKWTNGFLLDCKKSTAATYIFKTIEDNEYLFVEWKMGNYVYGGAKPSYYVFIRQ